MIFYRTLSSSFCGWESSTRITEEDKCELDQDATAHDSVLTDTGQDQRFIKSDYFGLFIATLNLGEQIICNAHDTDFQLSAMSDFVWNLIRWF